MSKRVVIVGGGVIGLCTAYYCVERDFEVTVIERNSARRDGCSFGNAGLVVPSHIVPLAAPGMITLGLKWMWDPASPFHIEPRFDAALINWGLKFCRAANAAHVRRAAPLIRDLSLVSRACFEEIAALHGMDFGLVKKGLLMLCQTTDRFREEAEMAKQARALGLPAEVLDARQTAALDSAARMEIAGAVYFPLDCHLDPARFMTALQAQLEKCGVKFVWDSETVDFKLQDERGVRAVISSGGDEIEGDEFVLCGGAWTSALARKLGLKISMQAGKGYSLTLRKPRRLPRIGAILTEARVAVTPMGESLRVAGTMELVGLKENINAVRVRRIVDSFCRYYPEFRPDDFDGIQPWCGLRPCSPDGLPYVGRTARFTNVSLATGHAMLGLSLGPVSGRSVAEILCGEKPAWHLAMLSPDRYD